MNNIFKVSLLAAAVLASVGCNDKKAETTPTVENVAVSSAVSSAVESEATSAPSAHFATEDTKAAYAIGASVSRYIEKTLAEQEQLGVTLDKELIIEGISDALRGELKLKDEEVISTLQAYDKKLSEIAQEKQAEATKNAEAEAKTYFADNGKKDGVKTTASGLQYEVLKAADGAKPSVEDTVTVHYEGRLLNGEVFDSSITRGQPATFPLNRVIAGWTEGVQLMAVGSKYQFTIPSELAYGEQGAGNIPPHSALVFDVELISIDKTPADTAEEAAK